MWRRIPVIKLPGDDYYDVSLTVEQSTGEKAGEISGSSP